MGSRSAWSLDSCRKISWNFVFGVSKPRLHKENHSGKLRVHWGGDRTKFVSQPCSDVWISYLVWKPHLHFWRHYLRIWAIESIWIFERAYLPTVKAWQKKCGSTPWSHFRLENSQRRFLEELKIHRKSTSEMFDCVFESFQIAELRFPFFWHTFNKSKTPEASSQIDPMAQILP